MCHLLLALPFLALPLFWLTPLSFAVPVYSVIFMISIVIYLLAFRAMHLPVVTGSETLLHQVGVIKGWQFGFYRVYLHNELWNALSDEELQLGEQVEVVSVQGVTLHIHRVGPKLMTGHGADQT
ncbi:NfeD family protein [Photobacterium sp. 53610]|uniref:NfeD family protein n=1 Tax=Photobacterium sp. 53610 TaxID=3102789 RepID=UPI002ED986C1